MANTRNASYCELLRVSKQKLTCVNVSLCWFTENKVFLPSANANFRDCETDEHLCKYAMSELITVNILHAIISSNHLHISIFFANFVHTINTTTKTTKTTKTTEGKQKN